MFLMQVAHATHLGVSKGLLSSAGEAGARMDTVICASADPVAVLRCNCMYNTCRVASYAEWFKRLNVQNAEAVGAWSASPVDTCTLRRRAFLAFANYILSSCMHGKHYSEAQLFRRKHISKLRFARTCKARCTSAL